MTYDKRNRENLDKLAPNTKAAAYKWYQWCIDHEIDILIYETIRTIEKQRENVTKGASQTMKSYHLVGQALDFVPIINGKDVWESSAYKKEPFISAIRYAQSIGFESGLFWSGFIDSPHLQYNYRGYGTDKVLDSPTPEPKQTLPNGIIGVVRVKVDGLNIRTGTGTQYPSIGKAVKGRMYNVTANVHDWHRVLIDGVEEAWVFGNDGKYLELVR